MVAGPILLLASDTIARVLPPTVVPVAIVTAFLGPMLIWWSGAGVVAMTTVMAGSVW